MWEREKEKRHFDVPNFSYLKTCNMYIVLHFIYIYIYIVRRYINYLWVFNRFFHCLRIHIVYHAIFF